MRSRQWNKLVAVDGVLCTVATMAFYVLYLVGFKWGANGYLLAIISGDLVSVLFLMFTGRLWDFIELKGINKTLWKQMLHFSLPMIPAQISFWIINASDSVSYTHLDVYKRQSSKYTKKSEKSKSFCRNYFVRRASNLRSMNSSSIAGWNRCV